MDKRKSVRKPRKTQRSAEKEKRSYKLTVAYRGTNYRGWQKQLTPKPTPTVQEVLEGAIEKILGKDFSLHGSGRTDAGVHARAQVAHLRALCDLPPLTLLKAFNAHLPEDIRVLSMEASSGAFHAQLDASAKTYRYFVLNCKRENQPVHWPFLRPYTWFVSYPLNLEAMKSALKSLEGKHDFKSFQNTGTEVPDTVREILEARLIAHKANGRAELPWMPAPELDAQLLEIRIRGTGFLKQMVRTIVGTLVEIGRGKLPEDAMAKILASKDRSQSGITAPANGLFLDNVEY